MIIKDFSTKFCLRNICEKFDVTESGEVPLKGHLYDFSVDYDAIDKSDMLNIHKSFMLKNIGFIKKMFIAYY